MKSLLSLGIPLLFLLLSTGPEDPGRATKGSKATVRAEGPGKYALVFAIGDYPAATGWGKISSGNDVPLIVNALTKQGFGPDNIAVVRDAQATKQGIRQAFEEHLLNRINAGDVVFVHFSSHGQQVMDNNDDEIDGFDEAVIPYDAHLAFEEGVYEGELHLRDDELGELFATVRRKLGPGGNLLALIDACHSGTGTRGLARARGTHQKMAPADYEPEPAAVSSRGAARGQQAFMESGAGNKAMLAPMVTISGASADELNYETQDGNGKGVGSLSYAFSKVMVNADRQMTYRELFDRIRIEMQQRVPNQTPQIEGAIDQQLFGGAVVESVPYFMASYWEDGRTLFLESGSLQGLYDSTRVALFDLGARDLSAADTLARGYIVDAALMESYVVLDQPIDEEHRKNIKIVISGQNYGSLRLRVKLDLGMEPAASARIKRYIAAANVAEFADQNVDLLITDREGARAGSIGIYSNYDRKINNVELTSTSNSALERAAAAIVETIRRKARTDFLRNLKMTDARREVSIDIVPLKGTISRGRFVLEKELTSDAFRNGSGSLVFPEGQVFRLRVSNNGNRKAYFTILDFTPDGKLSLVIPNESSGMQPADYVINAGETIDLDQLFVMQAPFGNEMFKLIATEAPLDLRPIIDPIRGTKAGTRGGSNPFQQLMEKAASTSRAGTISMGSASAHISSLPFRVVE